MILTMDKNFGSLDPVIQEKLEADVDFKESIESLSDEEKESAIATKKGELFEEELKSIKQKAEEADKAREIAENQKKRAEKAEGELKKIKPQESKTDTNLTWKDQYALNEAKVPLEDVDEVVEYATLKKISVAEALKSNVVKTILAQNAEHRKTAEAASTASSKRTTTKVSPEAIIERARKGEIPEKGSKEAEELFWARNGGRR